MAFRFLTSARTKTTGAGARGSLFITGWEAAAADFTAEAAQIKGRVRDVTDNAAERIRADQVASGRFVDRSGTTRDSVRSTAEERPDAYVREIGPTWFVARYLVFGTVKMPPKWDLFGASLPGMRQWQSDMSDVSTL